MGIENYFNEINLNMWCRVSNIRKQGKVIFFDVIQKGNLFQCKISSTQTSKFEQYQKILYRGLLIKIIKFSSSVSKNGYALHVVEELDYVEIPTCFPKNYPKNPIKDKEILYKNRCLSMITNPELYKNLNLRFKIIALIRDFFKKLNVPQVDIPVLESSFGGAFAKPVYTHINAVQKDFFLRTSFEFPLKRLVIGGFPQLYYLGSSFRNEGLDKTHTPEFLQLEYYTTSLSYSMVQNLVEDLYRVCYFDIHKNNMYEGFDLKNKWPLYTKDQILDLLKKYNLEDVDKLIDLKILGPCFHMEAIEDTNPLGIFPFVFDSYVDYDMELATGYQQENNPFNLSKKGKLSEILDATFEEDLSYGMPPTVGLGIGVDRLVKSLLKETNIRDVQVYPLI